MVCRYYNAEAVLWAVGATAFVSFTLTLFAMQTKVSVLVTLLCSFHLVYLVFLCKNNNITIMFAFSFMQLCLCRANRSLTLHLKN